MSYVFLLLLPKKSVSEPIPLIRHNRSSQTCARRLAVSVIERTPSYSKRAAYQFDWSLQASGSLNEEFQTQSAGEMSAPIGVEVIGGVSQSDHRGLLSVWSGFDPRWSKLTKMNRYPGTSMLLIRSEGLVCRAS
jgi:hypothetical protein